MTKRNLLLASLLLVFGFGVMAPSAMAQALPMSATTTQNVFRPNSNGDAIGPITLTIGSSTAPAPAIATGQIITFTFSAPIVGATGVAAAFTATPALFCESTTVPNICTNSTLTAAGATVTLTTTAPIAVVAGEYIIIHGFRASTYGLPAGTEVTALCYASNTIGGVPAAQPITFENGTNTIVVYTGYIYSSTALTDTVPAIPGVVSTCIGLIAPPDTWPLTITENYPGAWTSDVDETELAGYDATNGSNLAITVTGIPDTVTVTPPAAAAIVNLGTYAPWLAAVGTTFSAPTPTTYTSTADGSSATFVYQIVSTARPVLVSTPLSLPVEGATFTFTITSTGALHTGLGPMQVSVQLNPPPATAAPFVYPAFSYPVFGLAEEEPGTPQTVWTFVDCVTHLFWPYVTNLNTPGGGPLGNWDTAIEVANGTSLPYSYTSIRPIAPQKGSCTFYYYSAGTATSPGQGTQATPVVAPTTTPYLNSGGIFAFMLSNGAYGAPGLVGGYAVATCGFQNAAGYGAIVEGANGASANWDLYANYLAGYLPN
jgi:hypothetical protein